MGDETESEAARDGQLLTGDDKWWEFLDPDTYALRDDLPSSTRSTSHQLDWSRAPDRRKAGPVGFAFFNHCSDCGQGVPPDFTFCVHCGGLPRSSSARKTFSIVIADFDGDDAFEAARELIVRSGVELTDNEVEKILREPPAVFNVHATRDEVAALTAKLAEVGISARGFALDDPSVPWLRETIESTVRQPVKFGLGIAIVLATIVGAFSSLLWVLVGMFGLAALLGYELRWYRTRYHLSISRMLELVTGFDRETALIAQETLRSLSDREVRGYVTSCLMEYYTLTQQIRAHGAVYGDVLERSRHALEDLMADVLRLAHQYSKMDDFLSANRPAAIEQKIGRLQDSLPSDPAARQMTEREIETLSEQLVSMHSMEEARGSFRERLGALSQSMENLRHRIASVRAQRSETAWREIHMEEALQELDEEFEVFEETFAVVSR